MNDVIYRQAGLEDVPALVGLRMEFLIGFWDSQTEEAIESLRANTEEYFRKSIADKSVVFRIAESGGRLVAMGGISFRLHPGNFKNPAGKTAYVLSMYTNPAYRRKGICSTILQNLMATAMEMGINSMELHASPAGEPVYIQHGFEQHSEPTYRIYDLKALMQKRGAFAE